MFTIVVPSKLTIRTKSNFVLADILLKLSSGTFIDGMYSDRGVGGTTISANLEPGTYQLKGTTGVTQRSISSKIGFPTCLLYQFEMDVTPSTKPSCSVYPLPDTLNLPYLLGSTTTV